MAYKNVTPRGPDTPGGGYFHAYRRTLDRQPMIRDDQDERVFMALLEARTRKAAECGAAVLAYALMPNHFHLIVRDSVPGGGMSKLMHGVLRGFTHEFNGRYGRVGPLWGTPYPARPLVGTDDVRRSILYTHLNPQPELRESNSSHGAYLDRTDRRAAWIDLPFALALFGGVERYERAFAAAATLKDGRSSDP